MSAAKKLIGRLRLRTYDPDSFENPELQCHHALIEGLALRRDAVDRPEDHTTPDQARRSQGLGFFFITPGGSCDA